MGARSHPVLDRRSRYPRSSGLVQLSDLKEGGAHLSAIRAPASIHRSSSTTCGARTTAGCWRSACTSRSGAGGDKEVIVRFLRPRQVLEIIGVSRTTLWRMVQAGTFPRPVCITERNRGYLLESVEAWMTARAEERPFDVAPRSAAQARTGATRARAVTRLPQGRTG